MNAHLIAKFQEPKLPGMDLLIAKGEYGNSSPDDQGWCIKTVAQNGDNPSWSAWLSLGEVELLHSILMVHLGMSETDAEKLIERTHKDGLTVQQRLSKRIH
jgi:hypothetical protein